MSAESLLLTILLYDTIQVHKGLTLCHMAVHLTHKCSMRPVVLLFPFTEKKTEAQRAVPQGHVASTQPCTQAL